MTEWLEIVRSAKILVVDDDAGSRRLIERLLEGVGYATVRSCAAAELAIESYRELEPDLVVLDLHLPGVDGFELLQGIAAESDPRSFVPILVVTGDVSPEAKLHALLCGAKDFLTKPIDTVEAMLRIRILLETRFRFVELERELQHLRSRPFPDTTARRPD